MGVLALFIAHLDQVGAKPATISTHISAISYIHKLNSWLDPAGSFIIQKMLKSSHKHQVIGDLRLPITRRILRSLLLGLDHTIPQMLQRVVFKAMFSLAFHAFLRLGEMAVANNNQAHVLSFSQICLSAGDLVIHFLSYKHSQGRPFSLTVVANGDPVICPVQNMRQYLLHRGNAQGPLFQLSPGCPVTRDMFNIQLRRALIFCRLHHGKFTSHSFRIGAATAAATQGCTDAQIRQLGRWQSDAFKKYIRCADRVSAL